MPEGGRLTVRTVGRADRIEFTVADTGVGIPPENRARIFTPFFTTRERGTGLGLAFVAEIARDHGSRVTVDRAPEGGARFRFTTPAGTPPPG